MAIDLSKPIDLASTEARRLLEGLQGNILKSHGRDHAILLFFRFSESRQSARKWLATVARSTTSAWRQEEDARRFAATGLPGALFMNVFLTASGLAHLRLKPPRSEAFAGGMAKALKRTNDFSDDGWDTGYRSQIDGALLLADDDANYVAREASRLYETIGDAGAFSVVEIGTVLRSASGDSVEHFGYSDGLSQPVFFQGELSRRSTKQWNPAAGPNLVLFRDPNSEGYGSFMVFRKLEQDVVGFQKREEEIAQSLGLPRDQEELGGAFVVGRFEDGTPVSQQPFDGLAPPPNDFNYARDPSGSRCPLHAHVRLANPRTDSTRSRRIARRGIPYGKAGSSPTGLLFMCFQADIEHQFEFLQRAQTDHDPVTSSTVTTWPTRWDGDERLPFSFGGFVTLRGSAYMFAPSMQTLLRLAKG